MFHTNARNAMNIHGGAECERIDKLILYVYEFILFFSSCSVDNMSAVLWRPQNITCKRGRKKDDIVVVVVVIINGGLFL